MQPAADQHRGHGPGPDATAAEAEPKVQRAASLIDAAVEATRAERPAPPSRLDRFLRARTPDEMLRAYVASVVPPGRRWSNEDVLSAMARDVARLDELLNDQLNAILHHPRFQEMEASWRGLEMLVDRADGVENLKIRVLNLSWKELARDLERAIEFDQSHFFRKIYSEEFGTPGGEPFGLLIGDYAIRPRPNADHPVDDVATLAAVSHVAAAAFAPFVASVHPSMFELEDFADLQRPLDLASTFDRVEYLKWRAFRETEDARFVGLTLPRILLREPYADDGTRTDGFLFREEASGGVGHYLWGNAAFALGSVVVQAIDRTGWPADIRGVHAGEEAGGLVPGLAVHHFATETEPLAPKASTDVVITDLQEKAISELGFIPLCQCAGSDRCAFYSNSSVQKPRRYDERGATMNARMSAMLQYILCVSRFAHYLKVAARDKIGAFSEAPQVEDLLSRWLKRYVTSDPEARPEVKAQYPLREARVQVREHPDKPGSYLCVAHLWPHFQLEELSTTVRVTTVLAPAQPS